PRDPAARPADLAGPGRQREGGTGSPVPPGQLQPPARPSHPGPARPPPGLVPFAPGGPAAAGDWTTALVAVGSAAAAGCPERCCGCGEGVMLARPVLIVMSLVLAQDSPQMSLISR